MSAQKVSNIERKKPADKPGKPGWSEYVKAKHDSAVTNYKLWRDNGKPRYGPYFDCYYKSKMNYKYAVRAIKRKADTIKADNVAKKYNANNFSGFWNAVSKFNRVSSVISQQIGDAIGEEDICNQWKSHFSDIYNCVHDSSDNVFYKHIVNNVNNDIWVTDAQVCIAVNNLQKKSSGIDSIFCEHLKFCSVAMLKVLCKLLNCFIAHGFLPSSFMSVLIKPIYKKKGSVRDIDCYRPIALANCISKLFEAILRDKLYRYLFSSSNQFGYKKKSNTDTCLYVFKEIIDVYDKCDSNLYCCFLDASKAYDRISHKTLFNQLIKRNVPIIFVRIIAYWYKFQQLYIKWGNTTSTSFSVSNGVRQGSVLSPYLFCVYVDEISTRLNKVKVGCMISNLLINHLFYADDLCIFSPSSRGLQLLLNVCFSCGNDIDVLFNESKCKVMIFKARSYRKCNNPSFFMGGQKLKVCESYKYLGHIICSNRSDNLDITRQLRSVYAKGNSLIRTFYKCSDSVKVTLFNAYCSSLYTAQLWRNYTKATLRKLCVAYHSVFKQLLNFPRCTSNSMLFVFYNVRTFQELLRKCVFGFCSCLKDSSNPLVQTVSKSFVSYSSLTERWNEILY